MANMRNTSTTRRDGLTGDALAQLIPSRMWVESEKPASRSLRWAWVAQFESVAQMLAVRDAGAQLREFDGEWAMKWPVLKAMMDRGAGPEYLATRIEKRVASVSAGATMSPGWEMAPAGAYPIVPAAIGGDPFSMRRRVAHASEQAPVRVWLPLSCSCGVGIDEYAELMALVVSGVVAISETRPIEMVGYASLDAKQAPDGRAPSAAGCFMVTVPIASQFGDYRQLAQWCLPTVGRTVAMGLAKDLDVGFDGHWAFNEFPTEKGWVESVREALECSADDVLVPPAFGCSGIREMLNKLAADSGVELAL